jgi:hypothetical protein
VTVAESLENRLKAQAEYCFNSNRRNSSRPLTVINKSRAGFWLNPGIPSVYHANWIQFAFILNPLATGIARRITI